MKHFLIGFFKRAADALLKWNSQGGVDPRDPEAMARAQNADLITFPKGVEGANCANCQYVRILDEKMGKGFCTHPEVLTDVSPRMCCSLWDAEGVYRSWEAAEAEQAQAVAEQQSMAAQEQAMAQEQAPAPKEKKPAPKEKKKEPSTININVGGKDKK